MIGLLAATAAAADRLTRIERPGCTIDVPDYFVVGNNPPGGVLLEAWAPKATDRRGLSWHMAISVEPLLEANPSKGEPNLRELAQKIRLRHGSNLLEGPEITPVQIAGADAARFIVYRAREDGMLWRHCGLYVHTGQDVYVISAHLRARAGSEVLAADHPALEMLRKSTLSFRIVPAATTQATTQPASRPSL